MPDVGGDLDGVLPGHQIVRDLAVPPGVDTKALRQVQPVPPLGWRISAWALPRRVHREKAPSDAADLVDENAEELAEAVTGPTLRRQRPQRKAVPLGVVQNTIASMKASGEKVTGPTLAEQLGCPERSGYRYLGEAQVGCEVRAPPHTMGGGLEVEGGQEAAHLVAE
ncbi:hypothetical protein ACFTZI_16645 [Streptomyces decoyicus]|uniref:hypothetical protein n=1 Tax=Streptomyces decoyicus TaxID=249567 RepID=UPI00362B3A02